MALWQNDSEVRSVGGLWWTPGEEQQRFSGTLTLGERRRPALSAIDPPDHIVNPGSQLPVLHGVADDLGAVFTNEFAKKANAKYPKG